MLFSWIPLWINLIHSIQSQSNSNVILNASDFFSVNALFYCIHVAAETYNFVIKLSFFIKYWHFVYRLESFEN